MREYTTKKLIKNIIIFFAFSFHPFIRAFLDDASIPEEITFTFVSSPLQSHLQKYFPIPSSCMYNSITIEISPKSHSQGYVLRPHRDATKVLSFYYSRISPSGGARHGHTWANAHAKKKTHAVSEVLKKLP